MQRVLYEIIVAFCGYILLANCDVVRNEDICGPHNGRRLYLELGERGILYAKNVSLVDNSSGQLQSSRAYVTNSSHDQCSLELVTCPSCVITVTFKTLALSHHCNDGGMMMDSPCRCDYVWMSEPPYEDVSGSPYCGIYSPITYRSSTRTLSIVLLYSQSHRHAFTLEYTAERNRLHLNGADNLATGSNGINSTGGGILTSPFFPTRYPRDLGMEYIITCPADTASCRVRVLFSDFQLATVSIIEFYDWNGQRLDVSSGARFRPPVIVSSGPSLLIRFYANGGTGLGYKAFYSFVFGHLFDKTVQPITDCGGYVENLGGAITMMDMVGQGLKTYDCVWLIRPPKNFLHMKTHMYLKVVTFAEMAGNTELTIKQGPTSALLPLEVLRHPASQLQPPRMREHVALVSSGFHVSLRGTFGPTSRVAIAYAAFSYMDCFTGSDFLCQNHRCIPSQLNCDGFDHCGDNSDEPSTCFRDWEVEPQDRRWHMNKPNYYFPKIDRYPDLKTATLVFVASSLGLIVLISALIILLYRMGARARQQRELQSRLQTISELLDGARIDEITVSDDPPVYEAPPGYDEVVKVGMDGIEVTRRKKKGKPYREPRSRSTPNHRSQEAAQSSSPLIEDVSTRRSGQSTPSPADVVRRAPESPPPPYVTPPGTIPRNLDVSSLSILTECTHHPDEITPHDRTTRRSWQRTSGEHSRSLTAMDVADSLPIGPSTSADAEALGAYLQNYASTRSPVNPVGTVVSSSSLDLKSANTTSDFSLTNDSQPGNCCCVSSLARRESVEGATESNVINGIRVDVVERSPEEPPPFGEVVDLVDDDEAGRLHENRNPEATETTTTTTIVKNSEKSDSNLREIFAMKKNVGRTNCACAGACGCANDDSNDSRENTENRDVRRRPHRRRRRRRRRCCNDSQDSQRSFDKEIDDSPMEFDRSIEEKNRSSTSMMRKTMSDVDAGVCTKTAIIRLLGNSRSTSRTSNNCSLNSTTVSSASSTPNGSYGRAFGSKVIVNDRRDSSVRSTDSRVTKISTVTSEDSIVNIHDEFVIVSETSSAIGAIGTTDFSGSSTTAKFWNDTSNGQFETGNSCSNGKRRRGSFSRRRLNCDVDGLYESIRALDNFLAKRADHGKRVLSRNRGIDRSIGFGDRRNRENVGSSIIFGSSSLGHARSEPTEATFIIDRSKNWRSSEDAFSN